MIRAVKEVLIAVTLVTMTSSVMTFPVMAARSKRPAPEAANTEGPAFVRHHTRARTGVTRPATQAAPGGRRPTVQDCIHIAFPQCGGDAEQPLH